MTSLVLSEVISDVISKPLAPGNWFDLMNLRQLSLTWNNCSDESSDIQDMPINLAPRADFQKKFALRLKISDHRSSLAQGGFDWIYVGVWDWEQSSINKCEIGQGKFKLVPSSQQKNLCCFPVWRRGACLASSSPSVLRQSMGWKKAISFLWNEPARD